MEFAALPVRYADLGALVHNATNPARSQTAKIA